MSRAGVFANTDSIVCCKWVKNGVLSRKQPPTMLLFSKTARFMAKTGTERLEITRYEFALRTVFPAMSDLLN